MWGYADREILLKEYSDLGNWLRHNIKWRNRTYKLHTGFRFLWKRQVCFLCMMRLLVGYFSFSYFLKNMYSRYRSYFVKGNGVPELTYLKFDINQHVIPGLLVKEKASMALMDRILQISGQTVIDSSKLSSNFLFVASPVRYDHDRHHNWHVGSPSIRLGPKLSTPSTHVEYCFYLDINTLWTFPLFGSQFNF